MRTGSLTGIFGAGLLLAFSGAGASPHHGSLAALARRHVNVHVKRVEVCKRAETCALPTDPDGLIVPVLVDGPNKGWAMTSGRACSPGETGMYCPYACKPGYQMVQWNPDSGYVNTTRVDGGLWCDTNGEVSKPFPGKPYCIKGHGTVSVQNEASDDVAVCQTVLPGYEEQIIPNNVVAGDTLTIDVPGPEYWNNGQGAAYYVNAPGVSVDEGCVWGTESKPVGNWSPYQISAYIDGAGKTWVTLGWNPIYAVESQVWNKVKPEFGIKTKCEGTCSASCEIDPANNDVNQMTVDPESAAMVGGAGGASACNVAVEAGSNFTFIIFKSGESSSYSRS